MKFEIADWRFEVTWAGLLCQPIERGQAKVARKSSTRHERRKAASAPTVTRYPHVSVAPVEHEARIYEVRLEQVPGGLRLGQWQWRLAGVDLPEAVTLRFVREIRARGMIP